MLDEMWPDPPAPTDDPGAFVPFGPEIWEGYCGNCGVFYALFGGMMLCTEHALGERKPRWLAPSPRGRPF